MIDLHPTTESCSRCAACAWERVEVITERVRGRTHREEVVQCCFCGLLGRAAALAEPPRVPDDGEWRFQFGRFEGMTMAEADRQDNGRAYLVHMARTNEKLGPRIAEYLARNDLDRPDHDGEIVAPTELSGAGECHASQPSLPRLFGKPNSSAGG